jgi:glycosyltransferase involved in cell wall biosynthesis
MGNKILILFVDPHLAYSPTTLNLMATLEKRFEVKLLTLGKQTYFHRLNDSSIIFLKEPGPIARLLIRLIHLFFLRRIPFVELSTKFAIAMHLLFNSYHRIIAVDNKALWFLKGVRKSRMDLLSLELVDHTKTIFNSARKVNVENVIIQNAERLKFIPHKYGNVFFIQNSPPFYESIQIACRNKRFNNKLIYSGTAVSRFGIYSCLNFIANNRQFELTMRGSIPPDTFENILAGWSELLHDRRLIINTDYLNEFEYCKAISDYGIGFCFYEFFHPEIQERFDNYYLAPSGKMFKYFASGVPIIGNDIPGLSAVKEYKAGILLKSFTNVDIKNAIDTISRNYSDYVENCFKAAKHFDFSFHANKYVDFIKSKN